MKPLVSIIVPIYNVEKYLRKCIDSILNQTLENIEVILVNDGSTDNSGKIIDEYKVRDSRVIAIHKENGGQSSARNIGLDIAIGKYIGFVDGDDWIDENMILELYTNCEINSSDVAVCGRKVFDEEYNLVGSVEVENEIFDLNKVKISDYIIRRLMYIHTMSSCNKLYKKDIIDRERVRFKDVSYVGSEDALFNYSILCIANKIISINKKFYNGVARKGSTCRAYRVGYMERTVNLIQCVEEYTKKLNKEEILKVISPSIFLFFQQWNLNQIRTYSNSNKEELLALELKNVASNDYFSKMCKEVSVGINSKKVMQDMGFRFKGRMVIRVFMMLCYLKKYKLASKFILAL